MSEKLFQNFNILGSDSWTFSHVMPGVVWHDNPAEEHSEYATQIEQLDDI